MTEPRYITIPKWNGPDGFQHYKNRDPVWIKVYTRLHSDDAFLSLTGHQRAVLLGLWVEYARSGRHLVLNTRSLTARLNLRVMTRDLEALKTLGFIDYPLAARKHDASPEEKRGRRDVTTDRSLEALHVARAPGSAPADVEVEGSKSSSDGLGASGSWVEPGGALDEVAQRAATLAGPASVTELDAWRASRGAGVFGDVVAESEAEADVR